MLKVELVTPEKLEYSAEADQVVVPGAEGDFGVLPGHAPLVSLVRPGLVDITKAGGGQFSVFVTGGFAEVSEGRCTILADEALQLSSVTRAAAEARQKQAETALSKAGDENSVRKAKAELEAAETLLRLV